MKSQDEFSPLYPLLEKYWDKPLSELPNDLQAKVRRVMSRPTSIPDESRIVGHRPKLDEKGDLVVGHDDKFPDWEEIHADNQESGDTPLDWDELTRAQRQSCVAGFDYTSDPSNEEERRHDRETSNEILKTLDEIERLEGYSDHGNLIEANLKADRRAELEHKLARLNSLLDALAATKVGPEPKWIEKARRIADEESLKRWESGIREITARNICDTVATKLGKDLTTHGNRGPRASGSVRSVALKGWKFNPPTGTNGTSGTNE
jgi:hypothetical protein